MPQSPAAIDYRRLEQSCAAVRRRWRGARPVAALILGSGWGEAAAAFEVEESLPYAALPALGAAGVAGHAGRLALARCAGLSTLVFQGRRHLYEGRGWTPVAAPVYLCRRLGVRVLVLTNAAGGMAPGLKPGDLMVITDHINAMCANPLTGPHDPVWGPRFPDQSRVYDPALARRLAAAVRAAGAAPRRGIYLAAPGPTYETPAEVRAYRRMGADAVGMSTVPEAILANAAGLRVAGLSCITNRAAGLSARPLRHEDVTGAAARALPRMKAALAGFWTRLADQREKEMP